MLKASKYEASHKIRFLRVVVDYNVDRMQVYRQRCHSRALLIARPLFAFRVWRYIRSAMYGHFTFFSSCLPYSGDYSTGVPPLPIPNREVKPGHADGTASSGRVGSCRFLERSLHIEMIWRLFVFIGIIFLLFFRLYPLPDTRLLSVQYPPQFILFYLNSPLKVILLFTL